MHKDLFLKELQTRIRILAEAEQQDILDEYAQHIDLQLAQGLSEDAAIADFGSLDDLAAEILEAYHVNPAATKQILMPSGVRVVSVPDPRPGLKRAGTATANCFRRMGGAIARFFRRVGNGGARLFRSCGAWLAAPFRPKDGAAKPPKEKKERVPMESKHLLQRTGAAVRRFFRALGRLIVFLARLAWNLLLLLAATPLVLAGIFLLVCVGTLVVLLFQGYPLAGVTLCCVGGVLCCGSILVLGSGLRVRRAAPQDQQPPAAPVEALSIPEEATDLEVTHA